MPNQEQYRITSSLVIPASELLFTYSRSSGKGGQHVNKVNTKVSLWFDIEASQGLSEEQKQLLRQRLAGRVNNQGALRIDGDRQRSQSGNREEVVKRFISLLQAALHINKSRRKTRPSLNAKQRRLQVKKKRGRLKLQRGKNNFDHD